MSQDDQVMNRFERTGKEYQDSIDGKDGKSSKDGKDAKDNGGIKDRRESFQAYIPAEDKEGIEATWRKIKALCSLSDREEPTKNDFYAAVVRAGYNNTEQVADELDLYNELEEYEEVIMER